MDQYIGTKIIEAAPAVRKGGKVYDLTWPIPRSMEPEEPGYRVRYQDGYESWSPKDVFERAYLPLHVNPDLKTDRPSVSQKMVDEFITKTEVTTMGEKTTVVRAVLRNGFEIVEKIGRASCRERV